MTGERREREGTEGKRGRARVGATGGGRENCKNNRLRWTGDARHGRDRFARHVVTGAHQTPGLQ